MLIVDSGCPHCNHTFRWPAGTALRCPRCRHLLGAQPITWGQYWEAKAGRLQRQEVRADHNPQPVDQCLVE